jgi:hypothetical protein
MKIKAFHIFTFIILGLFLLFAFLLFYNANIYIKENFDVVKANIVLLGDSILDNRLYVLSDKSVVNIIEERNQGETYCYARDDATISDVYNQLEFIPKEINASIFLSVGGNNILYHYENCKECFIDKNSDEFLDATFDIYKDLVKSITIRCPNNKIYLLDIYYPTDEKYQIYRNIVSKWNQMLHAFALNNNNVSGVLQISNVLTKDDDFVSNIEPSQQGGYKIAEKIIQSFYTF